MNNNKINQPLILVAMIIIILYAASFIKIGDEIDILGIQLQNVDIFSDLKEEAVDDYYDDYYDNQDTEGEEPVQEDVNEDGVMLQKDQFANPAVNQASFAVIDQLRNATISFISSESMKLNSFNSVDQIVTERKIEGNVDQLKYFFDALKLSKSKKIRIAHYGDSQIEGDLVTGAIRDKLQKQFGGQGVGYLAITSQDRQFRITTDHQYPENSWETGSIFVSNREKWPVGIGGEVFVPNKSTWVSYETRGYFSTVRKFSTVNLYYSDAKNSSVSYSFDGNASQTAKLSTGSDLKELVLDANKSVSSIKIEFPQSEQAYFYGVSLEGGNGIYVDNLPLRGNTGTDLQKIPVDILNGYKNFLDYKLIILQFGKNAMGANFIRYEREMAQAIEHLQKAFPNTSFLLISVQDSGFKTGSRTTGLLSSQIKIAKQTGIAFWNLFEAMGGKNSMPQWVKSNPPLASADHTHFNHDGSKRIGEMIVDALLDAYKNYK